MNSSRLAGLQAAHDSSVEEMLMNNPISVNDAAGFFVKKIDPNDRPYTVEVLKRNNDIIEEYRTRVLLELSVKSGGVLRVGQIYPSFQAFIEGREVRNYKRLINYIPRATQEQVRYWIDFFKDSSLAEIFDLSKNLVYLGWTIITNSIRFALFEKKYDLIYSKGTDPYEWYKLSNQHQQLMNGKPIPFGLSEAIITNIIAKVDTVMNNSYVAPTGEAIINDSLTESRARKLFRKHIDRNERPYVTQVLTRFNEMVDEWCDNIFPFLYKDNNTTVPTGQLLLAFQTFLDARENFAYRKIREQIPTPDSEQLCWWIQLLKRSSPSELADLGPEMVQFARILIQNSIKYSFFDKKFDLIYNKSINYYDWYNESMNYLDLMNGKPVPFDLDEEEIKDINAKVDSVLSNRIGINTPR